MDIDIETIEEAEAVIESAVRSKVKRLDLNFSHRYRDSVIPDSIGDLSSLEYLTIYSKSHDIVYGIEQIPITIGRLINLRTLQIYDLYELEYLPDSIGDLTNLEAT
ncbi:MAG: hypothetical protein V7K38_21235 [Nostoc sp.]|uniref:hypothetical protein n=1 Tax=Nostoc sp. TaxID=1180 RepID=UPI002FFAAF64